jgi:hypothetical protein
MYDRRLGNGKKNQKTWAKEEFSLTLRIIHQV